MRLDRSRNTRRGSFWGIIYRIISILLPFITRTVLIKTIGVDYLGLNGLFSSILNLLNMSELGVGTAIVFSMYKPIAEDDTNSICALMSLYKKIYRYIGLFVLTIGLFLVPFLPNLIHGDVPSDINIYILYFIYLANAVITYWLFAYKNCLLQAFQRVDIINIIALVITSTIYILQIFILIYFRNYYAYVIVNPLLFIVSNCVTAIAATKLYPEYNCRGTVSKQDKIDISKRVAGLMMDKMALMARRALGNIVVSSFLGLTMVAIYNNYYYITTSIAGFMLVIINAMAAGIGNSIASETAEKNEEDFKSINFIYLSVMYILFVELLCCLQPFMQIWVGQSLCFPDYSMILFCVFFMAEGSLNVIAQYYDSTGLWWKGKWKGLIELIVLISLTILGGKLFGVIGVLVASIITVLFLSMPLVCYFTFKYYFKKPTIRFVLYDLTIILLLVILGLIAYLLVSRIDSLINPSIYLSLGLRFVMAAIIGFLIYIIVWGKTKIFIRSFDWLLPHIKIMK